MAVLISPHEKSDRNRHLSITNMQQPVLATNSVAADRQSRYRLVELAVLLLVFTVSVWVRLPNLDRPLSHNFEWLTAHSLIVTQIWYEQGGARHYFGQRMTFGKQADKYINNAAMSNYRADYPRDAQGNHYYMSHPSLGLLAPYLVFRTLNITPNAPGLQWFNMFVQLLCAIFLYLIILTSTRERSRLNTPAVLGGTLYLLMPATLWFHSNTYYIEMFVQLPFIVSVYLAILYENSADDASNLQPLILALLGFSLTVTVLSEWIGVVLSGILFLYALLRRRPHRDVKLLIVSAAAPAIGLGIYVCQYSLIVGFEEFARHLARQFLFQVGVTNPTVIIPEALQGINIKHVLHHYYRGFVPAFVLISLTFVLSIPGLRSSDWWRRFYLPFLLTFAPVLIHHLLLPRFTSVHWYSVLKSSYFLILVVTAFVYVNWADSRNMKLYYSGLMVVLLMLVPVTYFKYQSYAIIADPSYFQRIAHPIRSLAKDDEVVFFEYGLPLFPQMIYYAQRNIQLVDSIEEAEQWLRNSGTKARKGIVFDRFESYNFRRIAVDQ